MSLKSPLGTVRGLGSAKEGVQHWWAQRVTAIALIPLGLWFVISVIAMAGAGHDDMAAWLSSPFSAGLAVLLIVATFWHAMLGVQVAIEDYVHNEAMKIGLLLAIKGLLVLLGTACVLSVIVLLLQG
ncbi:MAG: succinate dehydrogenase, hydrophobic membrane anchor protein [Rhodospirillales bacterium]|nr:succinate dehydrogenase, hydrophobic membrane anchor protein [Rhodospirillales bacterium]